MKKPDILDKLFKRSIARGYIDQKIEDLQEGFEADAAGGKDVVITDDLFDLAEHNAADEERTGYSNYSYWRSTFNVFFSKKITVFILGFLVILLLFPFVQPLLPNQKDAYTVYNDAEGNTLRNLAPNSEYWFGTSKRRAALSATNGRARYSGSEQMTSARISGREFGRAREPHCSSAFA